MLIGGEFFIWNMSDVVDRNYLARLDADGSVDLTYRSVEGYVCRMLLQPDGKIIRASYSANFPTFFDIQRHNSDGSIDNSFVFASGGNLRDMVLQADGKILL